ncbi:unnamed protein product [Rotaria sp. Silwood1]|nr:unnamed protein product [Rotaria sp. Silwood1]CAF4810164.1 unnamed protein product [Rotaria sp. Silwood1]
MFFLENTPVHRSKSHLDADENQPQDSKDEEYVRPKTLANYHITDIKKQTLPCSASTQMIIFYFDIGCEITIRVSGTEPTIT